MRRLFFKPQYVLLLCLVGSLILMTHLFLYSGNAENYVDGIKENVFGTGNFHF